MGIVFAECSCVAAQAAEVCSTTEMGSDAVPGSVMLGGTPSAAARLLPDQVQVNHAVTCVTYVTCTLVLTLCRCVRRSSS